MFRKQFFEKYIQKMCMKKEEPEKMKEKNNVYNEHVAKLFNLQNILIKSYVNF